MVESRTCIFFISFRKKKEKKRIDKKNGRKRKKTKVLELGVASIPLRYTLLGVIL